MAKKINIPVDKNVIKMPIEEAMPDNYLPYAVEVAKERALPDVRDGLKPVHRRILYGAYMLRAFPDKPYYKSARIVGDILGKYHPHGDTSVYDAMVILAQNFTTRVPLIDGHGNWGSQDGDSAAAMRYTEARLTPIALEMLRDIDKDVVEMVDNYSASEKEPDVLPSRYPNILVNGSFGIAVGLATNIPPHNLNEVINAALAYIDNSEISTLELMKYIKGPDLPTGGILIGKNSLLSAYETGEGKVTLRAKTSIEKLDNGRIGIVITEFPYRRSKAKLLQTISEMTADKRHAKALEAISDIRDETDRTGVRAVIEFKKSIEEEAVEKVLKYLLKKTDLQCNLSFNMVAVAEGKPVTLGLKAILHYYIEHQKEIVTRRTKKELEIASRRFHIVEGFIKAIGIMDKIIETIRASKSKKDAQSNLMNEFGFSVLQAEAILELMLYRLTGLEIKAFEKEYRELEKEIKRLTKILQNEKELMKVIKNELSEIAEKYGDPRRTEIIENDEEAKIDVDELIVDEDIIITMSNEGYIKKVPIKSYNRSNSNVDEIEYREGDSLKFLIQSNTTCNILFFTDRGNLYQIKGVSLPEYKWKEKGERIDSIIKSINLLEETIISVYSIPKTDSQMDFILFTDKGGIKKIGIEKYITNYSKLQALKLRDDEKLFEIKLALRSREEKFIKVITENKLEFTMEEPKIESSDRNTVCYQMINLPPEDRLKYINFQEEIQYKDFFIYLDTDDKIKISKSSKRLVSIGVQTNTKDKILLLTKDGAVYSYSSFMFENIGEEGIHIQNLVENNADILCIASLNNTENMFVYYFTAKGLIKKTALEDFIGNYYSVPGYKLKSDDDKIINIEVASEAVPQDVLLITEKGMCIRFESDSVSLMGRIASGVTGITLKYDDLVIYGNLVEREDDNKSITLKSQMGNIKKVRLQEIKAQNRAGKGKNIMLVVMDDKVAQVENNR